MPTRGRTQWAEQALRCFHAQTYTNKELVILDDGDCPSFPEERAWPEGVRYYRESERIRYSIPEKRNKVCSLAQGEIIFHLDDDDWSAPMRMTEQVKLLEESGKAMAGYHTVLFYNEATKEAFRYFNHSQYILGTSLVFLKSFWEAFHFPEKYRVGSDNQIVRHAKDQKQLVSADAGQMLVARIHTGNTSSKPSAVSPEFKRASIDDIPAAFFE